jgi:hypothetical protein
MIHTTMVEMELDNLCVIWQWNSLTAAIVSFRVKPFGV